MNYEYIIGLFLFTLFFRSLVRIFFPKLIDFDTYFHLFLIDYIRKNGISNLIETERFIKPFGLNYPWMVHFIFSLFPKKWDSFLEKFFNPILDSLFVVVLYIFIYYVTGLNEKALYGSLLYIFTPATFSILGTGPRIKSFTPRLFGEIVGSLTLIFEYLYLEMGSFIFLFIAIFFASLVFLASKFSLQALVFINVFIILFTQDLYLLSVIIGGFVLAIIYSKGKYLDILKQQLIHLKWYFIQNLKWKMAVSNRNSIKVFINLLKEKNIKGIISYLLFENSFFILIYKIPIVLFVLFYLDFDSILDIFIVSGLIIFIISSLKWFLFIGEAERYINYILPFIVLKAVLIFNFETLIYFIIYGFIYYLLDIVVLKKITYKKGDLDNDVLINWLNQQNKKLRISTIPFHLGGWRIVQATHHNWLYSAGAFINEKDTRDITNFMISYPFLDINQADKIIDFYNLDYIFYNKKVVDRFFKDYKIPPNLKQIKISENIIGLYK